MRDKQCKRCGETKPLADYYPHPRMADGHLNICKSCVRTRVSAHRLQNLDRIRSYDRLRGLIDERKARVRAYGRRNREKMREIARAWAARNQDKVRQIRAAWCRRNPEKRTAHSALWNALRSGKLERQPCSVCQNSKSEAHHPDYSKPLDVIWLCRKHHAERHRKYPNED